MKKFVSLFLAAVLCMSMLAGCSAEPAATTAAQTTAAETTEAPAEELGFGFDRTEALAAAGVERKLAADVTGTAKEIKIGVVLIGDETEGYTAAHMNGIKKACENLGINPDDSAKVLWKYKIPEDDTCTTAIEDLVAQGCNVIFSNSYGHQDFMAPAAEKHPEVQFIAMTGDTAAADAMENFGNSFTEVYQSRYVSGVVAGMKVKELAEAGKIPAEGKTADGKVKIGYVGAFPYAEVVSGYTAFFLGIQSVYADVVMDVQYTSSWYDWDAENQAAKLLMDRGCVIIGQHADSTGAPTACEEALGNGKTVFSVGYNIDMLPTAPNAALTSATNTWAVYYEYAIKAAQVGEKITTNWTGGYKEGAVAITELGKSCAAGTQEKVDAAIKAITEGTLNVFDTSKFTVGGKTVTYAYASDTNGDWTNDSNNVIADGYYHESFVQSAPAFTLRIDGITELNAN